MSETWCPLPWANISTRNNGDLRVCCQMNVGHDMGLLRKEDGSLYNAGNSDLIESRNSNLLKEVRKDMLDGKWNPACVRCKDEEAAGIKSRLSYEKERFVWPTLGYKLTEEIARQHTQEDGTIDIDSLPVAHTDLRFGNLCNLKCRMCGPTDSHMWYDDQVAMFGPTYKESVGTVTLVQNEETGRWNPTEDIYGWHESDTFWQQMEEKLMPGLKSIYVVGGEPFMITRHWEFLEKCIERGYAKDMIVEYNSNVTNVPPRAWDIWKHFKEIQIGMSIDAIGPLNDYIRHPAKWSQIEANMRKLDVAEGNFRVWMAATIQVLNIDKLPDMMIWMIKQEWKRINTTKLVPITPHPLHHPQWLNMQILPLEVKQSILETFEKKKPEIREAIFSLTTIGPEKKEKRYQACLEILTKYSKFLMQKDMSNMLPRFWENSSKLDELRDESLEQANPELYELIKHTKPT